MAYDQMVEITYDGVHYFVFREHVGHINFNYPAVSLDLLRMSQYAVDGERNELIKSRTTIVDLVRKHVACADVVLQPRLRFSEFDRG